MPSSIKVKILVVDDEPEIRQMVVDFLRDVEGYDVVSANDGPQALELLAKEPFDLVLSDINMPGMSGLELLKNIKQKYENPPPVVMMITAYGDAENYNKSMELGADDFLTKPLDFSILKEKLKLK